ncbi:hypothetical protein H634G_00847 [Metarhizium anisopliae BRIP 53293]|uniref:Uncharacterized protein n=1 Tax=Metarhizium anisopliae BRIP 53293 TaxID=1291518 RepID=A0A0D9PFM3_METAN|nr:hypothetical protein H634G_00847 [Metarhizium anisopliae BRIP 53293]KJK85790.1 hypothetical protein H633G_10362 [Metarhizium anisopliae BRIP 53284]
MSSRTVVPRTRKRKDPSSKAPSTLRNDRLADSIESFGYDVMPCSFCSARGLRCKMIERSSKCGEFGRIISESKRLDQEEERAEEQMLKAQAELNEALARLARLRRQKRQLVTKGQQMTRLGLQSLDALEEEERRESEAVIDAQSLGAIDVLDWNAVFGDALLNAAGDTAAVGAGNSSNAP